MILLIVDPWQYDVCGIRSDVTLCTLLNGALPGPYLPVRVTRGALVAHRYTYVSPRCRNSQCRMTFITLSVSLWNDLANPVFDGVGLAGFKSRQGQCFFIILSCSIPTVCSLLLFFLLSFFSLLVGIVGLRSSDCQGANITLSQLSTVDIF